MVLERQQQELKRKQASIAANEVKRQKMMEKQEKNTEKDEETMDMEETPPAPKQVSLSVERLKAKAGISVRQCEKVAREVNPAVGRSVIQSRSAHKRAWKKKETPFCADDSVVTYADIIGRLEALHRHFPDADCLRISSDKGGKCIKTSVAFARGQSEYDVQILHAVIADKESYDVFFNNVFYIYHQVNWYCSAHHLTMIVTCDHKVTSMLLGHKGQSAKHPCWLCTLPQSEFEHYTHQNVQPFVRSLVDIEDAAARVAPVNKRRDQLRAAKKRRTTAQKQHDDRIELKAASIANVPLNSTPTQQYVPAPLHTFMGICGDIINDWITKLFGEGPVHAALCRHGIFFNRNSGHGLDGNAVKKLFTVADKVLQSLNLLRPLSDYYWHLFASLAHLYELSMCTRKLQPFELTDFADAIDSYIYWRAEICKVLYNSYDSSERRYTPKEHMLICHFLPFIRQHGSMGLFSEQAHEKIHHAFNVEASRIPGRSAQAVAKCIKSVNENHLSHLSLSV